MPNFYRLENASDAAKQTVRDFIKIATNICWNCKSQKAASAALLNALHEHPKYDFLQNVVYGLEDSTPANIIKRIMEAHPRLSDCFFTERGIELMTLDGKIMLHILSEFVANRGNPAWRSMIWSCAACPTSTCCAR